LTTSLTPLTKICAPDMSIAENGDKQQRTLNLKIKEAIYHCSTIVVKIYMALLYCGGGREHTCCPL